MNHTVSFALIPGLWLLAQVSATIAVEQGPPGFCEGGFVRFTDSDGTVWHGTVEYVTDDCWLVDAEGKGINFKGRDVVRCESTGESKRIKPVTSYGASNYQIFRVTLTSGEVHEGGFTANLVVWIKGLKMRDSVQLLHLTMMRSV